MASWSYAFRRMRILFAVIADICPIAQLGRRPVDGAPPRSYVLSILPRLRRGPKKKAGLRGRPQRSLDDLGDHSRAYGAATLADREPQALVHGDRLDQLDRHLDVVTRHHHLGPLWEVGDPGHVGRAEVELGPVAREERGVTATLLLLEAVDLSFELGVRRDRARLAQHLAALDLLPLGAAEKRADVVAGLALVEDLAEHLDPGHDGFARVRDPDDLDLVAGVDD